MPTISRLAGRFFSVLLPIILAMLWAPAVAIGQSPTLCHITEGLFGAKAGNDKKAAALSFVQSAVGSADAIASKNIVDANKFQEERRSSTA